MRCIEKLAYITVPFFVDYVISVYIEIFFEL